MTVLTLAIVLLSVVAFVRTQILKQEEVPITGIELDKTIAAGCGCPRETGKLSFVLQRAQPISVAMVDDDDEPVRTLLDGALRASGRETLAWDGTDDAGRIVPDGDYRVRVDLATPDRTITIPTEVKVEAAGGEASS
jgi:flagellar hook assembly protein FlgD